MREFTYVVPLEGTYRISNLLPKDTDEDFCMYEPVRMNFCTSLEEPNTNHLFQVICEKGTLISPEELLDIITGSLPWRLCAVDVDWQGLKLTVLDNDMQIATCRLKFGCRIRICFTTTNDSCGIVHRYFYNKWYEKKNSQSCHIVEVEEEEKGIDDRRVLRFMRAADGTGTIIKITDIRS